MSELNVIPRIYATVTDIKVLTDTISTPPLNNKTPSKGKLYSKYSTVDIKITAKLNYPDNYDRVDSFTYWIGTPANAVTVNRTGTDSFLTCTVTVKIPETALMKIPFGAKATAWNTSNGTWKTIEIDVIPMSDPSIIPHSGFNTVLCSRCNEEGEDSISGKHLKITAGLQWYPTDVKAFDGFLEVYIYKGKSKYDEEGFEKEEEFSKLLIDSNNVDYEVNAETRYVGIIDVYAVLTDYELDPNEYYFVEIIATDDNWNDGKIDILLYPKKPTVICWRGGTGVSIGQYPKHSIESEYQGVFEVSENWATYIDGDMFYKGSNVVTEKNFDFNVINNSDYISSMKRQIIDLQNQCEALWKATELA